MVVVVVFRASVLQMFQRVLMLEGLSEKPTINRPQFKNEPRTNLCALDEATHVRLLYQSFPAEWL